MASSSSTYLLPGPSSTIIGSKSILIKQSPPTILHPVHHQFHPPSLSSHSHQQIVKSIPSNDTFHSLTVMNPNNGTNTNEDNGSSGSNGHSLSQSMESINNIGLTDDEVRQRYYNLFLLFISEKKKEN
jgi:hypothetical protein